MKNGIRIKYLFLSYVGNFELGRKFCKMLAYFPYFIEKPLLALQVHHEGPKNNIFTIIYHTGDWAIGSNPRDNGHRIN